MYKKFFLLVICCPSLLFANPVQVSRQDESTEEIDELNAYDPFIDYIDFQDSENEEEDSSFFQTGRLLSVGGYVGYRHFLFLPDPVTGEIKRNTTDAVNYGAFLKSFVSLNIAVQFSYIGSASLFTDDKNNHVRTIYHNLGVEFRYYWNRTKLVRALARLNPYIFGGVMLNRRTSQKLVINRLIPASSNSGGLKTGFGLEYHVSTRFHIGLHAEYNFMFIQQEECITTQIPHICPPENVLNAMFVLGRNF
ncbi:MAG: hypothetical protein OXK80_06255 [Bdellovibrionales bacterium]|nr:hypothetical protein [Bdellovibrionales bacterium]